MTRLYIQGLGIRTPLRGQESTSALTPFLPSKVVTVEFDFMGWEH